VNPDDSRIDTLFKLYDKEKTGKMSKAQFMDFFLKASTDRVERVLENFKCHHIRPDLQKTYMVKEESEFSKQQMPRYTMSANQRHFNILMNVLDKNKDAQENAWDLIRMLHTN
jgi:Ca2+-binding EF-hand superfamily protein